MANVGNLSLYLVILNSILGGGLFVNLANFNNNLGGFGPLLYLLGYAIFFPIIFCIGNLAQQQKVEGGLFLLAKNQLGEFWGFLTCWSYFLGRAVSAGLLLRFLALGLGSNFPQLQTFGSTGLALILLLIMVIANILGLSNTGFMQKIFTILKLLPLLTLLGIGSFFFSSQNFNFTQDYLLFAQNFKDSVPSAVYALQGFTIVIHIGHLIAKPENLLKILLLATCSAGLLCAGFQAVVFGTIGGIATTNTMAAFTTQIGISNNLITLLLNNLVNIAVFSSTFMIITGNAWNLFALAKNDFLPGKSFFLSQIGNTPAFCLAVHAALSTGFIIICQNILALQAASVFAAFCAYLMCSIAASKNFWREKQRLFLILGIIAVLNCLYILLSSLKLIIRAGLSYEFIILFICGLAMILWKNFSQPSNGTN